MRNPRVLCNIHGNSPSGLRPRARACIFHKTLGLMLYLLHTHWDYYLSYLTFGTISYQSQVPNDKLVRMIQPVASAKLLAHVALRTDLSMSKQ